MKKICFVTTVSLTMKSFVLETAKYLYENCGYDITLICSDDEEFEKSLPDYIHYIPVTMTRGIDLSAISSILKFYKIFKKEKFDLIQYSTPNASCYASIAAFLARAPKRLYAQWGIRYIGMQGKSRKVFKLIEKLVCRLSTHIRSVSPLNRQFAVDEGLYPDYKSKVVGNGGTIGVDMSYYNVSEKESFNTETRREYNIKGTDFVYGFAGRISADKGCNELLSAFKSIAQLNENAKLLIVGPLEDNCGVDQALIEWAKESSSVIFTGMVNGGDMKRYYSAMNVLVHPTYREGFGMVIQEAGALAVPVITTKIPGASEVMENGVSCLLVEPKSSADLENAMAILLKDKEVLINLSVNAYKRTMDLYERQIMLKNQMKDYKKILLQDNDCQRIILSDKILTAYEFPEDTLVKTISYKDLSSYDNNNKVVAIAGSRAMAIKTDTLNFPSLKLFQLTSAGFDGVPFETFANKGVAVANAGTVYSSPIAETVIFGMLQMAKKLRKNPNNRHFKIQRHYNLITELDGKRLLVMGAGNIGTAVAERAKGFNMIIDGYDPYCPEKPQYEKILRSRDELINSLNTYDYIVTVLPDNEDTKGFIDKDFFSNMKKSAVIINVGRKTTFNDNDFYSALKRKQIGGAVLDMFEKIPNPFTNKYRRLRNVIVLPGVSAISKELNVRLKDHMYKNIIASLNGEEINNVINGVK